MQTLIKQIRTYLNMSQTDFAQQLNVTFATVNRWENGRAVPNKLAQSKIYDLCKAKGVPVCDMTIARMTGEEIAAKLLGNTCGTKGTSCADQLAKAVTMGAAR